MILFIVTDTHRFPYVKRFHGEDHEHNQPADVATA
jgi:hypothetical protein